MKLWIMVLACVLVVGCSAKKEAAPKSTEAQVNTTEAESAVVTTLRAEAHARGLKWKIWCRGRGTNADYSAWAVYKADPFAVFIEDGAKPHWFEMNFTTQDQAAEWLAKAIQASPNTNPPHAPAEQRYEYCNSEIQGE